MYFHAPSCFRRAGVVLAVGLSLAATSHGFENLGEPFESRPARVHQVSTAEDGREYAWGVIKDTTRNGVFAACVETGETVWIDLSQFRPSHSILHVSEDDIPFIYSGTPGRFFKFDMAERRLVDLGVPSQASSYLLGYATGPDGVIYVGLFPETHLVSLNPSTLEIKNWGRVGDDPGQKYLLNPAVSDENIAYCPVGMVRPELWALDLATGERRQLFDAETIQELQSLNVTIPQVWLEPDGHVYTQIGERVARCGREGLEFLADGPTRKSSTTANRLGGRERFHARDGAWWIAPTIANGMLRITEAASRRVLEVPTEVRGVEFPIFSIAAEREGKLYGGGLNPAHVFEWEIATGESRDLGLLGRGRTQVYDIFKHTRGLFISSYPLGSITFFDPAAARVEGENPKEIITLAETHDQERAIEFVEGPDGRLYIGTIPQKGILGGALVRIDPATLETSVWRNIVPNQSIGHLLALPEQNAILGSSLIRGGTSAIATESEAKLFLWSCAEERIIWTGSPLPGASQYEQLVLDENGMVFGLADRGSRYFVFDPVRRETIQSGDFPLRGLRWRQLPKQPGPGGRFFGITLSGELFAIDPNRQWKVETLDRVQIERSSHGDLFLRGDGWLYFSDENRLWRVDLNQY